MPVFAKDLHEFYEIWRKRALTKGKTLHLLVSHSQVGQPGTGSRSRGLASAEKPLGVVGPADTLYIHAHGDTTVIGSRSNEGVTPEQLVQRLIEDGLQPQPAKLKVFACHSAESGEGHDPYAQRVASLLRDRWRVAVRVRGYIGLTNVAPSERMAADAASWQRFATGSKGGGGVADRGFVRAQRAAIDFNAYVDRVVGAMDA